MTDYVGYVDYDYMNLKQSFLGSLYQGTVWEPFKVFIQYL